LKRLDNQLLLSGKVLDEENRTPIAGANVYLSKTKAGTITNDKGVFKLQLPSRTSKDDTLVIAFLGYKTYRKKLSKYNNNSTLLLKPTKYLLGESIDVFAERIDISHHEIPHQREELTMAEIKRSGTSEIGDIFKKTSSVRLEGNDLQGRHIQIRGSDASEVNVYLDGILLNDLTSDHSADLSMIPVENISKLEILKGANFPLLGQGAFGGVVNFHSRKSVKTEAMLKAKRGGYDSEQYNAYLNVPILNNLIVNYFGHYQVMHPEIEYFPGERFEEKSKNNQIESIRMNHSLNLDYFSPYGQAGSRFYNYQLNYEKPGWTNEKTSNLYGFLIRAKNNFSINANWIDSKDIINRWVVETTKNETEYHSKRMNVKISHQIGGDINKLKLVGDYFHYELESLSKMKDLSGTNPYYSASLYDNRAGIGGIYSYSDQHKEIENLNWKLFIALRADFTAKGDKHLSNGWGLRVNWHKYNWEVSPYINYGKNVKYPTLFEIAYADDFYRETSQDTIIESLKPEFNNSFETGTNFRLNFVEAAFSSIEMNFSFFTGSTYNKIFRRPLGDILIQEQTGLNTTKGYEVSLKINDLFDYLSLSTAYTELDIGSKLLYEYKPELNLNFQAELITPFGFYLNSVFFYEGKSFAWYLDTDNKLQTESLKPSRDIDVSMGYRLKWLGLSYNLQAGVYNLLDSNGYDYYYLRKRMFMASFSVNY